MPEPLVWDAESARYRDTESGRYISRAAIRGALEESLANLTRRTDALTDDLRAGRISLNEWQDDMKQIVKQVQMAAQEVASGGRAQMTQADYGRVGQKVREQYQYLDRWVEDIKQGGPISEGRARQYLRSGRTAFLEAESREMRNRGYLARNVLRSAEHCWQCIAETDKGLVPVEFLTLPGHRVCLGNCRCFLVYEKAA